MKILGVDYGKKRIGLAWVDIDLGVVLPYGTVETEADLFTLIIREKINRVVLGLPLALSGEDTPWTKTVRLLARRIVQETRVPVDLFDERFSSALADNLGGSVGRDEKAAMVILTDYLERRKR